MINPNQISNKYTKEEIIELQSEAYYRAMKRIEAEKSSNMPQQEVQHDKKKWYKNVLFFLEIMFLPFSKNSQQCKRGCI